MSCSATGGRAKVSAGDEDEVGVNDLQFVLGELHGAAALVNPFDRF